MSRNGSGTYSLPSGNPVVTGTVISSTWANTTLNDIASALTTSIASDGQTPITANLPMSGYKLTGLGTGANPGDSVRYEQVFPSFTTDTVSVGSGGLTAATATVGAGGLSVATTSSNTAINVTGLVAVQGPSNGAGSTLRLTTSGVGPAAVYAESPVSYVGAAFSSNSYATASTSWMHFFGTSSNYGVANVAIYGNGNIQNANNSYGAISDARLKDKIEDAPLMRDRALLVRLVTYVLKADPDQKRLGVIAQEIKDVFPGLIEESQYRDAKGLPTGETYLTVKYSVLSLILYKAWQESEALRTSQIDALTKRIEALEAK